MSATTVTIEPARRVEMAWPTALFAASLAAAIAFLAIVGQSTLDDAYVYIRSAETFWQTGVPAFNAGDHFNITTSPLWLIWVGGLAAFVPYGAMPTAVKFSYIAFLALGALQLHLLLLRRLPAAAVIAALPIFFYPAAHAFLGLDTAITLWLGLALIDAFDRRAATVPIWAALFYLARQEGAILGALLGLVLLIEAWRQGRLGAWLQGLAAPLAVAVAIVAAWHLWYFHLFGALVPATAASKVLQGAHGWETFGHAWRDHISSVFEANARWRYNIPRLALALLGLIALVRNVWPLIVWPILHGASYTALGVAHYYWYYYPIDVIGALLPVTGASLIAAWFAARLPWIAPGRGHALGCLAGLALAIMSLQPARDTLIAVMQGRAQDLVFNPRLGSYQRLARIMAGVEGDRPFTLLTHEIGIFSYALPKAAVRDIVALATPVQSAAEIWDWNGKVDMFRPDWLLWPYQQQAHVRAIITSGDQLHRFERVRAAGPSQLWSLYRTTPWPDVPRAREVATFFKSLGAREAREIDGEPVVMVGQEIGFALKRPQSAKRLRLTLGFGRAPQVFGFAQPPIHVVVRDQTSGAVLAERDIAPRADGVDLNLQDLDVDVAADQVYVTITPKNLPGVVMAVAAPRWGDEGGLPERTLDPPAIALGEALQDHLVLEGLGSVDGAQRDQGRLRLQGWAGDPRLGQPAQEIFVLADQRVLARGLVPNTARPDLAAYFGAKDMGQAGFSFDVPDPDPKAQIRVIACRADHLCSSLPASPLAAAVLEVVGEEDAVAASLQR